MTTLRTALSQTPVATDYKNDSDALMRCERHVRTFDASLYRPATIERTRAMWSFRMETEHRSTSVFSAMCADLMDAGATIDMQGAVLRMALDELRHAELCGELVVALGGEAVRDVKNSTAPLAVHRGTSPMQRAMRNVIYGTSMVETINCARFVDAHETTTDPLIRDALRQLLSDEAKHAQFGFHFLEANQDWLESRPDELASLNTYLRFAFAVLERDLSARDLPERELDEDERAIGLPSPKKQREIFYTAVEAAIVPGLERLGIDAARAYKDRALG